MPDSIGELIDGCAEVFANCAACSLWRRADLEAMASKLGRAHSLHNYRCKCRTEGCYGFVKFIVRKGMRTVVLADPAVNERWRDEAFERRSAWLRAQRQC